MGTGRTFRKAPRVRPKKKPAAKRRRVKVQKTRLVALGLKEDAVNKMTSREVRDLLKRPRKIKK